MQRSNPMPVIRIDFDNEQISDAEVKALSEAVQKIVADVTEIDDVFVYANSAQIKVKVAPIEIFVQLSSKYVKDIDTLVGEMTKRIAAWKAETGFSHLINFTFIPMEWKIEIGI